MQFGMFDFLFPFFWMMFLIPVVIFFIIFVVVLRKICLTSEAMHGGGWVVEPPSFVIPEARRRTDGTQIKTVRLPDRCPSCNASLSHEGIDWVGPLEARCNYCGSTVKARFETM